MLKDYNCSISVYTFDAGAEKSFIQNFRIILDEKPDGLIFTPHFYEASIQLVTQCEQLEIPTIFLDTNMDVASNLSYFGQNAFQSGYVAAKFMHYGLPVNSEVLILKLAWNKAITPHMQSREDGFLSYFQSDPKDHFHMLSVSIDMSDKNEPKRSLDSVFKSNNNVAGIFVTNSRVHKVAHYLRSVHSRKLFLVGYDLTEDNLACLQNGSIDLLICQKPEEQGYNSILAMFNYLLTHKPMMKVNYSPIDILVKENVEYFIKSNDPFKA
jgi:LacI family transcriptional regulator